MTTSAPARPTTTRPTVPAPPPAPPVRARRRPALILLGVALVACCGLGGAWLATSSATTVPVVIARGPLQAGTPLTEADLATTQISGGQGLARIPGEQARSLVGKVVVSDVPAGQALAPGQVVDALTPGPGQAIVGVALKPGQLPATGLHAGNRVLIVVTTTPGATVGNSPAKPGTSWVGTVVALGPPTDDFSRTVDLAVAREQAVDIATAAGANAMALVLDER